MFNNAMEAARTLLSGTLPQAACVVDATAGNGHDTRYLCEQVPANCRVWALDIQPVAIAATAALLERYGLTGRARLVCANHAAVGDYVREPVDAAMFNLGYLPGRDHALTTRPEFLRPALDCLTSLLTGGGLITLVAYPGHDPGRAEIDFLETYLQSLTQENFMATKISFLNQKNAPALLYAIGKRRRNPG